MKGQEKIIATLNELLADELTAINQYMVHAEMCSNWHYERLHKIVEKRAFAEMKHAEKLIERILFLEGIPVVSVLRPIRIGVKVEAQLSNDLGLEESALRNYNAGIRLAGDLGDNGTRELLEGILKDEESHIDTIEGQLDQVGQMGLQNFLSVQASEKE